ncbi:hypothetical protein U8607_00495 [Methylobacterium durans]|uniref:hypothetical protein n=1 Tax=Methylobacterium durans TaxID=2202825 RepID=UPI002AFE4B0B|nr:hypothetical protein [Methylobacterium durans]MEA1830546.1 hypothetical protein [Methylobacterium durans]
MAANASPNPSAGSDPGAAGTGDPADWRELKHDVEDIRDTAVERGRGLLDAARAQAQDYVDRRKTDAAQSVNDLAKTLRDSSRTFDDRPNIKAFFDSAAEGLEQLGGSIEARSFADFYEDAEAFARRAPVAVAVGTFVAGFIAARFIKSSSLPPDARYDRDRFDDRNT